MATKDIFAELDSGWKDLLPTQTGAESFETTIAKGMGLVQKLQVAEQNKALKSLQAEMLRLKIGEKNAPDTEAEKLAKNQQLEMAANPLAYLDRVAAAQGGQSKSYSESPLNVQELAYESAKLALKNDPYGLAAFVSRVPAPKTSAKKKDESQFLQQTLVDPLVGALAGASKGVGGLLGLGELAASNATGGETIVGRLAKGADKLGNFILEEGQSATTNKTRKLIEQALKSNDMAGVKLAMDAITANPAYIPQFIAEQGAQFLVPGGVLGKAGSSIGGGATKFNATAELATRLASWAQNASSKGTIAERIAAGAIGKTIQNNAGLALKSGLIGAGSAVTEANTKANEYLSSQGIDPQSREGQDFILSAQNNAAGYAGAAGFLTGFVIPGTEGLLNKTLSSAGRRELAGIAGNATQGGLKGAAKFVGGTVGTMASEGVQELIESPATDYGMARAKGENPSAVQIYDMANPVEAFLGAIGGGGTRIAVGGLNVATRAADKRNTDAVSSEQQAQSKAQEDKQQNVLGGIRGSTQRVVSDFLKSPEGNIALSELDAQTNEVVKQNQLSQIEKQINKAAFNEFLQTDLGKDLTLSQRKSAAIEMKSVVSSQLDAGNFLNEKQVNLRLADMVDNGYTLTTGEETTVIKKPETTVAAIREVLQETFGGNVDRKTLGQIKSPEFFADFEKKVIDRAEQLRANTATNKLFDATSEEKTAQEYQSTFQSTLNALQKGDDNQANGVSPLSKPDRVAKVSRSYQSLLDKQVAGKTLSNKDGAIFAAYDEYLFGSFAVSGETDPATLAQTKKSFDVAFTKGRLNDAASIKRYAELSEKLAEANAAQAKTEEAANAAQSAIVAAQQAKAAIERGELAEAKQILQLKATEQEQAAQQAKIADAIAILKEGDITKETRDDAIKIVASAANSLSKSGDLRGAEALRKSILQTTKETSNKGVGGTESPKPTPAEASAELQRRAQLNLTDSPTSNSAPLQQENRASKQLKKGEELIAALEKELENMAKQAEKAYKNRPKSREEQAALDRAENENKKRGITEKLKRSRDNLLNSFKDNPLQYWLADKGINETPISGAWNPDVSDKSKLAKNLLLGGGAKFLGDGAIYRTNGESMSTLAELAVEDGFLKQGEADFEFEALVSKVATTTIEPRYSPDYQDAIEATAKANAELDAADNINFNLRFVFDLIFNEIAELDKDIGDFRESAYQSYAMPELAIDDARNILSDLKDAVVRVNQEINTANQDAQIAAEETKNEREIDAGVFTPRQTARAAAGANTKPTGTEAGGQRKGNKEPASTELTLEQQTPESLKAQDESLQAAAKEQAADNAAFDAAEKAKQLAKDNKRMADVLLDSFDKEFGKPATLQQDLLASQSNATKNPSTATAVRSAIERIFGNAKGVWDSISKSTSLITESDIPALVKAKPWLESIASKSMADQQGDLLTTYSRDEALSKQAREEQAGKDAAKAAPAVRGKLFKTEQVDLFNPQGGLFSKGGLGNAQALYDPRTGNIYLVTDRIQKGTEAAVWLHEVSHKQLMPLLGKENLSKLNSAVKSWRVRKEGTVERAIYEAANERASAASASLMPKKVLILAQNGTLAASKNYAAAKNGSAVFAMDVVKSALTKEYIDKIAEEAKDSTLVPVINFSEKNANRLPQAFAIAVHSATGIPFDVSVLRKTPDGRTAMGGVDRLLDTPQFTGDVVRGQKYYLLDDTITMGGTLAAMSKYITDNGGIVTGAAVMTGQERSATLAMPSAIQAKLRNEAGQLEGKFYEATGRRFDELTNSESNFILRDVGKFGASLAARGNGQSNRNNARNLESSPYEQEFLAYAIEEAVNRGVTPDAKKGTISAQGWMAKVRQLFQSALEKLIGKPSELTANDLVTMAYGAAQLELQGKNAGGNGNVQASLTPFDGKEQAKTPLGDTKAVTVDGTEYSVFNNLGKPIHSTVEGVRNFVRWFGDSLVTDNGKPMREGGKPMVVYHGTDAEFYSFNTGEGVFGEAVYLSSEEKIAGDYGGNLMPVYLKSTNIKKYKNLDDAEDFNFEDAGYLKYDTLQVGSLFAARNGTQLKSATENNGDFNPANNDIRLSIAPSNPVSNAKVAETNRKISAATGVIDRIKATSQKPAELAQLSKDYKNGGKLWLQKHLLNGIDLRSIAYAWRGLFTVNGKNILQGVVDLANERGGKVRAALVDLDNKQVLDGKSLVQLYQKNINAKELWSVMDTATVLDYDPSSKAPTGNDERQLYTEYTKLPPEQKVIYKETLKKFREQWKRTIDLLVGQVKTSGLTEAKQKAAIGKLQETGRSVYFAQERFGDYVNTVKDKDGSVLWFSRHETNAEANLIRERLVTEYGNERVEPTGVFQQQNRRQLDGATQGYVSDVIKALESKEGYSPAQIASIESLMGEVLNKTKINKTNANLQKRKNIAGATLDGYRANINAIRQGEMRNYTLEYQPQINKSLQQVRDYANDRNSPLNADDRKAAQQIADHMAKTVSYVNEGGPFNAVASTLSTYGFVHTMWGNISTAIINATNLLTVGAPTLGAEYGYTNAVTEMSKSATEVTGFLSQILLGKKEPKGDFKTVFDYAQKIGMLQYGDAREVYDIARNTGAFANGLQKAIQFGAMPMEKSEEFTNLTIMLAAYRMGVANGLDSQSALEAARDARYKINPDNASDNKSYLARAPLGRVAMQLKGYGIAMATMLYADSRDSFKIIRDKAAGREVSQSDLIAAKRLAGVISMHALLSGVAGVPFLVASPMLALAYALSGGLDDEDDLPVADYLKNRITDAYGESVARTLFSGVLGEGVSARVSIDNLIFDTKGSGSPSQEADDLFKKLMGPSIGGIWSGYKNYKMYSADEKTAFDSIKTSIPASAANILKSYELYTDDGQSFNKSGNPLLKENLSNVDMLKQMIGLRPADLAFAKSQESAIRQDIAKIDAQRRLALNLYRDVVMLSANNKDTEAALEMYNTVKEVYNGKYPEYQIDEKSEATAKKRALNSNDERLVSLSDKKHQQVSGRIKWAFAE